MGRMLAALIAIILMVSGCSQPPEPPLHQTTNVKITDKVSGYNEGCFKFCDEHYYISIERNGNVAKLEVNESVFKTIQKGDVVTLYYDDNNFVKKVDYAALSQ